MTYPEAKPVVAVSSVRRLACILGLAVDQLRAIAREAPKQYRPFKKRNRNGKERTIHNPQAPLKTLQSRIQERLLRLIELPVCVQGGVRGRSAISNSALHVGQQVVVAIDIRDFFPSVTDKRVFQIWREQLGFGRDASALLTRLTTFDKQLPQGAPTSTTLANLALLPADAEIRACLAEGLTYSRFVDDITVSGGREAADAISAIAKTLSRYGLKIHRTSEKCRVMRSGSRQVVTGLGVNARVSVPHNHYRRIRAAVRQLEEAMPDEQRGLLATVRGHVQWLRQVNAVRGEKLLARIEAVASSR